MLCTALSSHLFCGRVKLTVRRDRGLYIHRTIHTQDYRCKAEHERQRGKDLSPKSLNIMIPTCVESFCWRRFSIYATSRLPPCCVNLRVPATERHLPQKRSFCSHKPTPCLRTLNSQIDMHCITSRYQQVLRDRTSSRPAEEPWVPLSAPLILLTGSARLA